MLCCAEVEEKETKPAAESFSTSAGGDKMICGKTHVWFPVLWMFVLTQIAVTGNSSANSPRSSAFATLPAVTGPFAVGKITEHWIDESRIEPLSPTHVVVDGKLRSYRKR
jgi:hypothetical protein